MSKISIKNYNDNDITLSAVEYRPSNFDKSKNYAALVVIHPGGGVKEQTGGLYARKLAELANLVTIAYDASYQGESAGNHVNWRTHMLEQKTSVLLLTI